MVQYSNTFVFIPVGLNPIFTQKYLLSAYIALFEKKSKLFTIVILVVVGIAGAPLVLPNILHGYHPVHIVLHISGLVFAAFLTIVSAYAYAKMRTKKLLYTVIAFSMFIGAESLSLIDATWPFTFYLDSLSLLEISHMLIIAMLGTFTMAVFRNN